MPSGMNARPRYPRRSSIPSCRRQGGRHAREEGDRSTVACATRIYGAEYFIHKRAEQLPYSTNVWCARGRPRSRTYSRAHALHAPRGCCSRNYVRRGSRCTVNETRPCCPFFLPPTPSFSCLLPFHVTPSRLSFSSLFSWLLSSLRAD